MGCGSIGGLIHKAGYISDVVLREHVQQLYPQPASNPAENPFCEFGLVSIGLISTLLGLSSQHDWMPLFL